MIHNRRVRFFETWCRDSAVSCTKTAEPIEMHFGIWIGRPKEACIRQGAHWRHMELWPCLYSATLFFLTGFLNSYITHVLHVLFCFPDTPGWITAFLQGTGVCSSSCLQSSSSVTTFSHLLSRVLMTPTFWCNGWWDMKFKYWSVCVFFRYTSNLTFPSSFLINSVSRNGICPSVSSSYRHTWTVCFQCFRVINIVFRVNLMKLFTEQLNWSRCTLGFG